MADGRYFSTTKRGEIQEFKQDLNAVDRGKRKDAVKKVIAAMTVGKDVSSLFPDVVNCMQTDDMELKKLVYLYLINYAKTQPDLAIMAVNTFVKDSQDPNPLIRALAVRTMGCIRVDRITEYLCDPLQRCLKDDDPYVRKTAAVCVAKLHDISPELVEDRGFLDALRDMIGDANPMVVANAVAALSEIQDVSGQPVFKLDSSSLTKLLRALNECTEWGQVFILDALASYTPTDSKDAENIIERVMPRLQHANSAVVLSAIKVLLKNMEYLEDADAYAVLCKKLAPPLVTLLGSEPEIQYVALRCINLIVQRHPTILSHEVKVFFCKYNDPIYVKVEKLEIMVRLADENNIDQVLLEFKEYATEVDVDFVRRAVRAIGRCAISIEAAAERCVNVLLDLIRSRVNYVVQESVVVIRDIFRRYPNKYESVISTLCECLESLDEPEAKAAMVWIVGEYAERIDNADELLEQFLESFPEETPAVQLQLVTAAVKLFLKRPTERPQQLIQLVLTYATQETDNPDLRDRAYIYWRLLSSDPEAAKDVVLAEKPVISGTRDSLDPTLLNELLSELGTLASVYHKPANTFVSKARMAVQKAEDLEQARKAEQQQQIDDSGLISTSSDLVDTGAISQPGSARASLSGATATPNETPASTPAAPAAVPDLLGDLLDLDVPPVAPAAPVAAPAGGVIDLLGALDLGAGGLDASAPPPVAPVADDFGLGPASVSSPVVAAQSVPASPVASTLPIVLDAEKGKGLVLRAAVARKDGTLVYQLLFENQSAGVPLDGFMLQFNKNTFGLAPANQTVAIPAVAPGGTQAVDVALIQNPNLVAPVANNVLQVAVKCAQLGVLYLGHPVSLLPLFTDGGRIASTEFVGSWKNIPEEQQASLATTISDVGTTKALLDSSKLFVMAHKNVNGEDVLYVTARVDIPPGHVQLLLELRFKQGEPGVRLFYKSERADLAQPTFDAVASVIGA